MKKDWSAFKKSGFSLVEVILASSIFILLVTALVGAYLYGEESTMRAGNRARAVLLAEEGLEAARNLRDADFTNLSDGVHGLATLSNEWIFSGSSDVTGIFTRQITISTVDADRKEVISAVTWQQNPQRSGSVSSVTYLSNWQDSVAVPASCNDYTVSQGYGMGTCRQNINRCSKNEEDYLPDGDQYCTDGPSADTCCALP